MRLTLNAYSRSMHLSGINVPTDPEAVLAAGLPIVQLSKALADLPSDLVDAVTADLAGAGTQDAIRVASDETPMTVRLYGILRDGGVEIIECADLPWMRGPMVVSFVVASGENTPDARLDDWTVTANPRGLVVVGRVSGDSKGRFGDGDVIWTSPIADPDMALGEGVVVTTANSRYLLGRPMRAIGDLAMHA